MMLPSLSVIVPVYNGETTVARALSSLLAQSIPALEILVIDDGSQDHTLAVVKKMALASPCIRLFSIPHKGLSAARNEGLRRATGEYVGFLDADDTASPSFFTRLLQRARETGADCVAGDVLVCGKRERLVPSGFPALGEGAALKKSFLSFFPAVWNKIYRRALLEKERLFFTEGLFFEDVDFSHRAFFCYKRIAAVHGEWIRYRSGGIASRRDERLFHYSFAVQSFVQAAEKREDFPLWEHAVSFAAARYLLATFLRRAAVLPRPLWQKAKKEALRSLTAHFPRWRRNPLLKKTGLTGLYLLFFTPLLPKILKKEHEE